MSGAEEKDELRGGTTARKQKLYSYPSASVPVERAALVAKALLASAEGAEVFWKKERKKENESRKEEGEPSGIKKKRRPTPVSSSVRGAMEAAFFTLPFAAPVSPVLSLRDRTGSLGDNVSTELHDDAAERLIVGGDVEKDRGLAAQYREREKKKEKKR